MTKSQQRNAASCCNCFLSFHNAICLMIANKWNDGEKKTLKWSNVLKECIFSSPFILCFVQMTIFHFVGPLKMNRKRKQILIFIHVSWCTQCCFIIFFNGFNKDFEEIEKHKKRFGSSLCEMTYTWQHLVATSKIIVIQKRFATFCYTTHKLQLITENCK